MFASFLMVTMVFPCHLPNVTTCRRPGTPKLDKKQRASLQEMQTAEVIELIIAAGQTSLWDIDGYW